MLKVKHHSIIVTIDIVINVRNRVSIISGMVVEQVNHQSIIVTVRIVIVVIVTVHIVVILTVHMVAIVQNRVTEEYNSFANGSLKGDKFFLTPAFRVFQARKLMPQCCRETRSQCGCARRSHKRQSSKLGRLSKRGLALTPKW